jgi:hypothetical protein
MGPLRLTLLRNHVRPDDYLVMSEDKPVGRIYKRAVPRLEWLCTISGGRYAEWSALQLAGRTDSFEQAKRELTDNWRKVLAARLSKVAAQSGSGDPRTTR